MKWLVKWLVLGSVLLIVSCNNDETMDAYSEKGADVDKAPVLCAFLSSILLSALYQ